MKDAYKVLAYSPDDGWNLRGVYPTHTAAREVAAVDVPRFRFVAVALVRARTGGGAEVAVLGTNARHLLRFRALPENFRAAALAL